MKRKAFTTIVSAAMLISAIGCSNGGNAGNAGGSPGAAATQAPAATTAAKGDVKLRFAWWGGQARHDYTLKLIEMYQQKNPNVKIDAEYSGFDDYWKKLAPQAAANQLPDIIQMDISYLSQYGGKDQLEDLTALTKSGVIDTSAMSESAVGTGKVKDKLYGIPTGVNAMGAIYDADMIKKAGATFDPNNWSWSDLDQLAKKMKEQGKLLDHMRYDVFFPYYLRTQGQHYFNNDGTGLGYTDNKYFIDYWTQYKKWYDAGYMDTLDKIALSKGTPEENPVALGTGFMTMAWSNQFIPLQGAAKRPLMIGGLPGPNSKEGLYMKPSMLLSVAKSSKQKEEAAKFINWFLNDPEANKIIKGDRGIPLSSKVKEAMKPTLKPEEVQVYDYVAWAEKNSSPMDPPDPAGAAEVSKLLKDVQDQMLFKKITVEEGAAKFQKEANAILAKNKK